MGLLKRLLCKHDFQFVRNIHGDEIITSGWKRSIYKCPKCETTQRRADIHLESKGWSSVEAEHLECVHLCTQVLGIENAGERHIAALRIIESSMATLSDKARVREFACALAGFALAPPKETK